MTGITSRCPIRVAIIACLLWCCSWAKLPTGKLEITRDISHNLCERSFPSRGNLSILLRQHDGDYRRGIVTGPADTPDPHGVLPSALAKDYVEQHVRIGAGLGGTPEEPEHVVQSA